MATKVIRTPVGPRLRNTKTNKLAGSPPKKAEEPTASVKTGKPVAKKATSKKIVSSMVKTGKAIAQANDSALHEEGRKRFPDASPEELEQILNVEAMNQYGQSILAKMKKQETLIKDTADKEFLDSLESYIQSWIEEGDGDSMIEAFKKPEWAAGMCEEASASFGSHLKAIGIESEILNAQRIDTKAPHAVVKVGNTVIDWTLRQFNPKADVPSVMTLDEFSKTFTVLSLRPSEIEEDEDEEFFRLVAEAQARKKASE